MREWSQDVGSPSSQNSVLRCGLLQFVRGWLFYDIRNTAWSHVSWLLGLFPGYFLQLYDNEYMKYLKCSLSPAINRYCQVIWFLDISNVKYLNVGTTGLQRAEGNRKHPSGRLDLRGVLRPCETRDQWLGVHVSGTQMGQYRCIIISFNPHENLGKKIPKS